MSGVAPSSPALELPQGKEERTQSHSYHSPHSERLRVYVLALCHTDTDQLMAKEMRQGRKTDSPTCSIDSPGAMSVDAVQDEISWAYT
jgi:hypothetical protein